MNHRDAEDAEEGLKRRFPRSERSAQSASTCDPTAAWSKTIGVLCVLCILSGSNDLTNCFKFLRQHPDLRPLLHDTLDRLSRDPFAPRLELHALGDKLTGVPAVSLTHSYRLTLILKISEEEIVLLDMDLGPQPDALRTFLRGYI